MQSSGALNGLKVLDLTRVLAGPLCTMMMADLGAEVIKIEVPGQGDDSRSFSPYKNGKSAYFINMNRNKRGVTLNLKGQGKDIFLRMVKKADVVVENYRPGVMEKLGLGYEELRKVNPGIIYGAVSGFGHTGPYRDRPGYDVIGQAMSGLMSTTGWPETGPTRIGTPMADFLAGQTLMIGILAALAHRSRTGEGQKVDISLLDAGIMSMQVIQTYYLVEGRLPERIGNRYESNYPTDAFPTRDGDMVIGAANDKMWQGLCKVMGDEQLAFRPEFAVNRKRLENHAKIRKIIEAWTRQRTTAEAVGALLAAGVPAAPINTIADVVNDPHVKAREMFVEIDQPGAGRMKITGSTLKLSSTPATIRTPAPELGQDNEAVYGSWLGLTPEEIRAYAEQGVM